LEAQIYFKTEAKFNKLIYIVFLIGKMSNCIRSFRFQIRFRFLGGPTISNCIFFNCKSHSIKLFWKNLCITNRLKIKLRACYETIIGLSSWFERLNGELKP